MSTAENPFAGQGSVLLDIGYDVGALVVTMPAAMVDTEVEIRPVGMVAHHAHVGHAHEHGHGHDEGTRTTTGISRTWPWSSDRSGTAPFPRWCSAS